jgi:hypothetical protein
MLAIGSLFPRDGMPSSEHMVLFFVFSAPVDAYIHVC